MVLRSWRAYVPNRSNTPGQSLAWSTSPCPDSSGIDRALHCSRVLFLSGKETRSIRATPVCMCARSGSQGQVDKQQPSYIRTHFVVLRGHSTILCTDPPAKDTPRHFLRTTSLRPTSHFLLGNPPLGKNIFHPVVLFCTAKFIGGGMTSSACLVA